jgi:hypothetical protein
MGETLTVHVPGDQPKWTWFNVMEDLKVQGHLEGVSINPLSVSPEGCGGEYQGNKFYITWIKDIFLLLTMQEHSDALVKGFAKVVEYEPFCQYTEEDGLITVEWDKIDPVGRFVTLQAEGKRDLKKIEPFHDPTPA